MSNSSSKNPVHGWSPLPSGRVYTSWRSGGDSLAEHDAVAEHAVEGVVRRVDGVDVTRNLIDARHQLDPMQTLQRLLLVEVRLDLRTHHQTRHTALLRSAPHTPTRHTASTSMYSLTFRVRVMLP